MSGRGYLRMGAGRRGDMILQRPTVKKVPKIGRHGARIRRDQNGLPNTLLKT